MADAEKLVWIKKVVKKGKKYLVYINDEDEGIIFTEDQIVNYRIIKGNSFYQKDFDRIIDSLDLGKALDKVLKYIDYKPRTEKEAADYLLNLALTNDQIDELIQKLKDLHFIDDERYTRMFVEEGIRHQNGPNLIRHQLLNKGIKPELIDQFLANYTDLEQHDNALDMANKTLKTVIGLPYLKQKESIYSRLNRMGYDYSVINQVLSVISYSKVDNNRLIMEYQKLLTKELDQNKIVTRLMAKGYTYQDIKKVMSEFKA